MGSNLPVLGLTAPILVEDSSPMLYLKDDETAIQIIQLVLWLCGLLGRSQQIAMTDSCIYHGHPGQIQGGLCHLMVA